MLRECGAAEAGNLVGRFLELRSAFVEAVAAADETATRLREIMSDPVRPLDKVQSESVELRDRLSVLNARAESIESELRRTESEMFPDANRLWSRFRELQRQIRETARKIAAKPLESIGVDPESPAARDAIANSRLVKTESAFAVQLEGPNNMRTFIADTLPAIIANWNPLSSRLEWLRSVLEGKAEYGKPPKSAQIGGNGIVLPSDISAKWAQCCREAEELQNMDYAARRMETFTAEEIAEHRKRLLKHQRDLERGAMKGRTGIFRRWS